MRNADSVRTSSYKFERALECLSSGLILLEDSHIAFWNKRAEELVGFPAGEMIGRRTDEFVQRISALTANPEEVQKRLDQAVRSPEPSLTVDIEISPVNLQRWAETNRNKARIARFLSAQFFAITDTDGQVGPVGMLLHDVTREREADAMKSQLLSTVSHELRTPLASIKGFATTLLRQDVRWDDATQRDFLRIIEEESDRLTEIIDNLLDMSQLEAGVLKVEKEPIQIRTMIREVVDELRMRTEAHWFVVDLPSELPRVLADSRRVRQVLHNLLENAIKYSRGGQITVTCQVNTGNVHVSVSDQGEGIASEFINLVFERFFQVDGASTRRVGGSGLGLSISRGIIQAHGGEIWAESVEGRGSTFHFTLPLAPPESDS